MLGSRHRRSILLQRRLPRAGYAGLLFLGEGAGAKSGMGLGRPAGWGPKGWAYLTRHRTGLAARPPDGDTIQGNCPTNWGMLGWPVFRLNAPHPALSRGRESSAPDGSPLPGQLQTAVSTGSRRVATPLAARAGLRRGKSGQSVIGVGAETLSLRASQHRSIDALALVHRHLLGRGLEDERHPQIKVEG